jgi:hypothetical protein
MTQINWREDDYTVNTVSTRRHGHRVDYLVVGVESVVEGYWWFAVELHARSFLFHVAGVAMVTLTVLVAGIVALMAVGAIVGTCESDECADNGVYQAHRHGNGQGDSFVQFHFEDPSISVTVPSVIADLMAVR